MRNPFKGIHNRGWYKKSTYRLVRFRKLLSGPRWIIAIGVTGGFFCVCLLLFYPFYNEAAVVYVPRGTSFSRVARILHENKVIKNEFIFKLTGRFFNVFRRVKSGEYEFKEKISTWEVLQKLTKWEIKLYRVTIPEGYTIKGIARLLSKKKLVNYDRFLEIARSSSFKIDSRYFPSNLEGYLFPDTYYFAKVPNAEEVIIGRMLSQFKKTVIDVYAAEIAGKGYKLHDVVIIASLVEKEAMKGSERPIIARVFYNRLKRRMPLQSCSTVRYALDKYRGKLSSKDLDVESPFNTYLHPGLPPYPICSPGNASIKAAVRPADVNYLYFVSRNDGTHHFTSDYKEHRRAKLKYQGS